MHLRSEILKVNLSQQPELVTSCKHNSQGDGQWFLFSGHKEDTDLSDPAPSFEVYQLSNTSEAPQAIRKICIFGGPGMPNPVSVLKVC
jgi:hypothetical protein